MIIPMANAKPATYLTATCGVGSAKREKIIRSTLPIIPPRNPPIRYDRNGSSSTFVTAVIITAGEDKTSDQRVIGQV